MNHVKKRLSALQNALKKSHLDAWIIPGSDPHMSEYTPEYWEERQFITGFSGSAGQVVVTQKSAALWTDGRYYLQAAEELEGTGIELMKDRLPDTPSIPQWLNNTLPKASKIGVNPLLYSKTHFDQLTTSLALNSNAVIASSDLIQSVWNERPALPSTMFFALDTTLSGETVASKLKRIRAKMKDHGGTVLLVTALDEVAWLFNMRGSDIGFNPVGLAYALIGQSEAWLCTDTSRISAEAKHVLKQSCVTCQDYNSIFNLISDLKHETLLYDADKTNVALLGAVPKNIETQALQEAIIPLMKAVKNETEKAGFRSAMVKDGVALVKFFMWLDKELKTESPTEFDIAQKLTAFRAAQEGYFCDSFATIAGYNGNGAIIHYSANEKEAEPLTTSGILLLDSGGQYNNGTTDITRTVALGKVPKQAKSDFTRVLKGHIMMASAQFPKGTTGVQLDILARQYLWQVGLDYNHGTGHGVGHFLNVHEGPQTIRKEGNTVALRPGMVLSNEPGLYRTNQYGIRTENVMAIEKSVENEFGEFYKFETLTLFPIDTKMVDSTLLSEQERTWLNNYHEKVFEKLSPLLTETEKAWLKNKCTAI